MLWSGEFRKQRSFFHVVDKKKNLKRLLLYLNRKSHHALEIAVDFLGVHLKYKKATKFNKVYFQLFLLHQPSRSIHFVLWFTALCLFYCLLYPLSLLASRNKNNNIYIIVIFNPTAYTQFYINLPYRQ